MNIALDYDGTASRDIELWAKFVRMFHKAGHKVWIVTMRSPAEALEIPPILGDAVQAVICTSREAKAPCCEALGIQIDIWIDDFPLSVSQPASVVYACVFPIDS